MATRRAAAARPETVEGIVDATLEQGRVVYFPVKHFSPVCAWHVRQLIHQLRPAAVLIEGPDDATELIEHIVDARTTPPLTIFSWFVDQKNVFGMNGVLTAREDLPARFRGWWPLTEHAPEYQALLAGHEVGAALSFIDAPLVATIPHHHVRERTAEQLVHDRHLAESVWFDTLAARTRTRSFEDFWQATFEVGGFGLSTRDFCKALLTFACCARMTTPDNGALEADGTELREAHMRAYIDKALKAHPEGAILVVTGAFHSVALPWTKGKAAKVKKDKNHETFLTPHSFRALSSLYGLNRRPAYAQLVWEAMQAGSAAPFDDAATWVLLSTMRGARAKGEGLSTADVIAAEQVARGLAQLRGRSQVTLEDAMDAATSAFVKGDVRLRGAAVARSLAEVLVGQRRGEVSERVGQPPLMADYYAGCRAHRLDIGGEEKVVRCDVHKQDKHRQKSAFLHQCSHLEIPMFGRLQASSGSGTPWYRGPDPATGEDMHLIIEQWAVRWTEAVDAQLIELGAMGATIAQAAEARLLEQLAEAEGHAADTSRLLLRAAQMTLTDVIPRLLDAVEEAMVVDWRFDNLARALQDFVMLYAYRDALATTGHTRILSAISGLYSRAVLALPQVAGVEGDDAATTLDLLQALVRTVLTFEEVAFDRELLAQKLAELGAIEDSNALIRGAAFGVLYGLGATREKVIARELLGYLHGTPENVLRAGPFLEGLFISSKSIVMGSRRLLATLDEVISQLDWETFKQLLPDLRRAFTRFIPSELDDLARQVADEVIGQAEDTAALDALPISEELRRVAGAADARIWGALDALLKEAP